MVRMWFSLCVFVGMASIGDRADAQQVDWPIPKVEATIETESSLVGAARLEANLANRERQRTLGTPSAGPSMQSSTYAASRFRRVPYSASRSRFRHAYRPSSNWYRPNHAVPWAVFQLPPDTRTGTYYFGGSHPNHFRGR